MADNNMDISFEEQKLSELKNEINAELKKIMPLQKKVREELEELIRELEVDYYE